MNLRQMLTTLQYIERGGAVQRMHTIPTLHSQNVAAHSFGVVGLLAVGWPAKCKLANGSIGARFGGGRNWRHSIAV